MMSSSVYTEEDVVCQRSVYKGATLQFSDALSDTQDRGKEERV